MKKYRSPEAAIKRQIFAWLWYNGIYCWNNASTGIYDPVKGFFRRNNSRFAIKGTADILGILPGGRFLAIEVKTATGRVSPEQKAFLDTINEKGGLGLVARCVEDVARSLGLLRPEGF